MVKTRHTCWAKLRGHMTSNLAVFSFRITKMSILSARSMQWVKDRRPRGYRRACNDFRFTTKSFGRPIKGLCHRTSGGSIIPRRPCWFLIVMKRHREWWCQIIGVWASISSWRVTRRVAETDPLLLLIILILRAHRKLDLERRLQGSLGPGQAK